MTDLNSPERVKQPELDVPPRSVGTALPMFPPKPEDTVRGPLIVSALPAELPRSLRAAAAPLPVAVPLPTGPDDPAEAVPPAERSPRGRRRAARAAKIAKAAEAAGPGPTGAPAPGDRTVPTIRATAPEATTRQLATSTLATPGKAAPERAPQPGAARVALWRRRPVQVAAAAVVLVAAALAFLLPGDDAPAPAVAAPPAAAGEFDFHRLPETDEPIRDSDCTAHAYGGTKEFLTANRCLQLTRAVYSTRLTDGRTVYTSVSVVRMRTEWASGELTRLVREEGTGSVTDLLRDGVVTVPGLDRLSRGGFAASQSGEDVVIVESDTTDRDADTVLHKAAMKRVSLDAIRLGADLR